MYAHSRRRSLACFSPHNHNYYRMCIVCPPRPRLTSPPPQDKTPVLILSKHRLNRLKEAKPPRVGTLPLAGLGTRTRRAWERAPRVEQWRSTGTHACTYASPPSRWRRGTRTDAARGPSHPMSNAHTCITTTIMIGRALQPAPRLPK